MKVLQNNLPLSLGLTDGHKFHFIGSWGMLGS